MKGNTKKTRMKDNAKTFIENEIILNSFMKQIDDTV